jgi:ParB family chromosome partitioning protein
MSRKNLLSLLHSEGKQDQLPAAPPPPIRPLMDASKSKPMAAVSKSLGDLNDRSRRANEIERKLAEGQAVIELDTASIEPSFVQDRMEGDIDGLLASIREQGQQVPILVRPHPDQPGQYQVAFGHRRLRAITELGREVKAIVRDLTDEQLVIAQGQENNEREDLSFIEKARFAARLKERFSRDVITAAMSVDKSDLTRMFNIVDALPVELIDAIGPAPGVGRRSWIELVELLEKAPAPQEATQFALGLRGLASQDRFKEVVTHLKPRRIVARGVPDVLAAPDGARLAQVKQSKAKVEIMIDRKATPDFAAFVLEHVPALYAEYRAKHQQKKEA